MSGNLARRRMTKFMPADFKLIEARQPPLKDMYDEWLARIICYAFSVPASPFVSQVNRATSETLRLQATQEGLVPLKAWIKNALDHVIQVCMNEPGLEFVWVGDDAIDPLQQAQTLNILVTAGIKTRDEARADLGLGAPGKAGAPTALGKFNPHHDERGLFTTAEGAGAVSPLVKPAAYQSDFHDKVLQEQLDRLRNAGNNCVSEVRLTFVGETARLDILCVNQSGVLAGVEVKTGDDPDYTDQQKVVYPHAILGFGVTSPDPKISSLGFVPNAPLPPMRLYLLYAPGPGLPYRAFSLGPHN